MPRPVGSVLLLVFIEEGKLSKGRCIEGVISDGVCGGYHALSVIIRGVSLCQGCKVFSEGLAREWAQGGCQAVCNKFSFYYSM